MKGFHNSSKLLLTTALVLVLTLGFIATPLQAYAGVTYEDSSSSSSKKKSERYFSDVKKSTAYRKDIEWLAQRGAFKSIAKQGKKFKPTAVITRRQFGIILNNLYGDRITLTIKSPNSKVTQKFASETLSKVSEQLGCHVDWNGGAPKAKVTRGTAAFLIRSMVASAGGQLDPYPVKPDQVTPQP